MHTFTYRSAMKDKGEFNVKLAWDLYGQDLLCFVTKLIKHPKKKFTPHPPPKKEKKKKKKKKKRNPEFDVEEHLPEFWCQIINCIN